MGHFNTQTTKVFQEKVASKFQLFNSLFTNLPFQKIDRTGILLSLLLNECEEGYRVGKSPIDILQNFFKQHTNLTTSEEQIDVMFTFIQYAERQVVLFDAIEEAAFSDLHGTTTKTVVPRLLQNITSNEQKNIFIKSLDDFSVHLVLTAHPTQFYPSTVLILINDLAKALHQNQITTVNELLQQLGNTPFFQKQKPTPIDEANGLIWYLENVFYDTMGIMVQQLQSFVGKSFQPLSIGFWPGGDRDGNPFVTSEVTLQVANTLKGSILKCYYLDIRKLKRKLTFKNIYDQVIALEQLLYNQVFLGKKDTTSLVATLNNTLKQIKQQLILNHNSLFLQDVETLLAKIQIFETHFATIDVRQERTVHVDTINLIINNYSQENEFVKQNILATLHHSFVTDAFFQTECVKTFKVIKTIQEENGEKACNRYIISQSKFASNILEVLVLAKLTAWHNQPVSIDIVPLFETIDDLHAAPQIMHSLFANELYQQHLVNRNNKQTIMLGFSDGTKDGGYIAANFAIYKAKETLLQEALQHNIEIVFFDGRGGPPARGGGKTHQYYSSMDNRITKNIQLTIQGQTISSNFGTKSIAAHNIAQLCSTRLKNDLTEQNHLLTASQLQLLENLSQEGQNAYNQLKNDEQFLSYLSLVTPVKYYSETNIASRPAKRNNNNILSLDELRAIPFVGAWAQVKQNISGFYGVGAALQHAKENGQWPAVKDLYKESLFFKTLLDNCEMAMAKCFMPLTMYLSNDEKFQVLWQKIYNEFTLTQKLVLELSGSTVLMSNYPVDAASIGLREKIILPVITIQQFALAAIRNLQENVKQQNLKSSFEKIVIRSSFAIINAGRNAS